MWHGMQVISSRTKIISPIKGWRGQFRSSPFLLRRRGHRHCCEICLHVQAPDLLTNLLSDERYSHRSRPCGFPSKLRVSTEAFRFLHFRASRNARDNRSADRDCWSGLEEVEAIAFHKQEKMFCFFFGLVRNRFRFGDQWKGISFLWFTDRLSRSSATNWSSIKRIKFWDLH